MDVPVLKIIDLHVSVEKKKIIKGMNLSVGKGEVHVIFWIRMVLESLRCSMPF